ncbi:glycosyltransferase, partial [Kineococcus glutinatus]|uniref:glycosyltransferase n=1 Tax=Kineococcus glutinatus TaxID=1070872 RepID=UPI0031E4E802
MERRAGPDDDATRRDEPPGAGRGAPLVLVLGTADWDAVIATNQHHVARALAEGFGVVFAEGTGTRRLRPGDARRVLRRLHPAPPTGVHRAVPAGVRVVTPRIVPSHGPLTRLPNAHLLHRQVGRWARHPGPRVLWTYTPHVYDLPDDADVVVYHLVDLLHRNPGVDPARLLAAERRLAGRAALAIATSPAVAEHLHRQGFGRVLLLPNVADVALFAGAAGRRRGPREAVVAFAGNLVAHKLDLPLLAALARALRGTARLRLLGPLGEGTTAHPAWRELLEAGAEVVGPLPEEALAEELAAAAVGVVPYLVTDLTRGISPLKAFEYLAAGLPVVSTPLPAVQPVPGAVWVEAGAAAFADRVLALLDDPDPDRARRCQQVAAGHDWGA